MACCVDPQGGQGLDRSAADASAASPAAPTPQHPLIAAAHSVLEETGGWQSERVRIQWLGAERGVGLVAVEPIDAGECLLRAASSPGTVLSSELTGPWENAAFEDFVASSKQRQQGGDAWGASACLAVRLTHLLIRLARSLDSGTPLERYIAACPPADSIPELWPAAAQRALRGSAMGPRIESSARSRRAEADGLWAAWPLEALAPPPTHEELVSAYIRANGLVLSRAFHTGTSLGTALCPVVDLVNHASGDDANAKFVFSSANTALQALRCIPAGSEVFACYDPNADFLDLWERYAFFDPTATVHTAEIIVESGIVQAGTFWIPECEVPLECPLLTSLRASLRESLGADAGEQEIEQASLRCLADLIRAHLAAYPEEHVPTSEDVLAHHLRAARNVLSYEQRLLGDTLAKIEHALLASAPAPVT